MCLRLLFSSSYLSASCATDGMVASRAKRKHSPCQQDGDSRADEKNMCLIPCLPEDIWHHILSLMSMEDAARAASVSRAFLHSWRSRPSLTFTNDSLGLNKNVYKNESVSALVFYSKVSHILAMHSGIGLKTLKIDAPYYSRNDSYCLNSWLQTALAPGIEELTFRLYSYPLKANYNFPYSFLSNGSGESIRYIHLAFCSFHPSARLGSLRSLTRLHLYCVHITGEEVECVLCNSPALELLEVRLCHEIVCLKVPSILQRLSNLKVFACDRLEAIDNKAPNLSSFEFDEGDNVSLCSLSIGSGESIRYILLARCSFHRAVTLDSLRNLTRLDLCLLRITGEEVERFLCNSPALEHLEVRSCDEIVCLKVPCTLQRLRYLKVRAGDRLEAIDNKAPNVSSFEFINVGNKVSLGGTMQIKRLTIKLFRQVLYPHTELPSMMSNLEALTIHSMMEKVPPALHGKFLHLRHLSIEVHGISFCPTDEFLPLANFLDAAPCLETFHLDAAWQMRSKPDAIFDGPLDLRRQMREEYQLHSRLKNVTIKGFCCANSFFELAVHFVESTTSLECLILEAAPRCMQRCSAKETGKCSSVRQGDGPVSAIRRYIEPKVPSTAELRVLEPCSCRV